MDDEENKVEEESRQRRVLAFFFLTFPIAAVLALVAGYYFVTHGWESGGMERKGGDFAGVQAYSSYRFGGFDKIFGMKGQTLKIDYTLIRLNDDAMPIRIWQMGKFGSIEGFDIRQPGSGTVRMTLPSTGIYTVTFTPQYSGEHYSFQYSAEWEIEEALIPKLF